MGFFDAFTGKSQAKDLTQANAEATAQLRRGYKDQDRRYDEAAGLFQPYADQGRAGSDFYYNALGLGTPEQQTAALNTLTSNPLFQGQLGQESNALMRNLNARGAGAGGQAQLAGQRVFQQTAGNWLDRYRDLGQQGYGATGNIANIRMGQGDNAYGYRAALAGNAINYGNAMAGTRSIGVNNMFNALGTAINAYNAFQAPQVAAAKALGGG